MVDELRDIATASLTRTWIDETERALGSCSNPAGAATRLGMTATARLESTRHARALVTGAAKAVRT